MAKYLMTTEEYLQTPETKTPTELIYGVLRVADTPLPRHQRAVADLFLALARFTEENNLGEVWLSPLDIIFDAERHLVLQPDLFVVSNERSGILQDRFRGAPDLVVEVLSPHPRIGKLDERLAWFAQYNVRECWLIHQLERHIEVVTFAGGSVSKRISFDERTPIQSVVLPGFNRTPGSILRWNT
jgi:Uma2 family endonuclease